MNEPIVMTGVGVGVPHGWTFDTVADGLLAGRSCVDTIRHFDASQHPSQIGAFLGPIPQPTGIGSAFHAASRLEQLLLWCGANALQDAGLWEGRAERRIGIALGTAGEWAWDWEIACHEHPDWTPCDPQHDRRPVLPFMVEHLGVRGPTMTLSTACASGNFALAQAKRWLELGWCDAVLAGACDVCLTPVTLAGFGNLRALSRRNDAPAAASRPFDRDRDGFVLGEGGTIFVLERQRTAHARKARCYGELLAVGLSSDAYHPVIPNPEPTQAIHAIRRALAEAQVNPESIDYANTHGTSTPVGDIAECKALGEVFASRATALPISSTKSMMGHLVTAASAVEALACLVAFARQALPPTINLDNLDPECLNPALTHIAHTARAATVQRAISNSFGFGGSNSCALFGRC